MTQERANDAWRKKLEAEIRTLYYGDLAARYARKKQWFVGASFLLSSGGAVLLLQSKSWPEAVIAAIVAGINAYALATGLDVKALRMARLHAAWNRLSYGYEQVWNHWYNDHTEADFDRLLATARDLSETATTEAPNDRKLMDKWSDHVIMLHDHEATT